MADNTGRRTVPWVVLIRVCPCVGQKDLAARTEVGKGIQNVGELRRRQLVGLVVAAIDAPGLVSLTFGQVWISYRPVCKVNNVLVAARLSQIQLGFCWRHW
jgi:hypothetical protein